MIVNPFEPSRAKREPSFTEAERGAVRAWVSGGDNRENQSDHHSLGTSLKGPTGSVAFLKPADTAIDVLPPDRKTSTDEAPPDHKQVSAAGRAQAIATQFGKGRVVVLGEAAMLTAQVASRGFRFGMNVAGIAITVSWRST